jgi:hypothetical protein
MSQNIRQLDHEVWETDTGCNFIMRIVQTRKPAACWASSSLYQL